MEILEFRSQIGYLIDQLPEGIRAIFGRALSVYYLEFDDVSHLFFFLLFFMLHSGGLHLYIVLKGFLGIALEFLYYHFS